MTSTTTGEGRDLCHGWATDDDMLELCSLDELYVNYVHVSRRAEL